MIVIRAHFDGSAIVPDEPIALSPQARLVVLADSDGPANSVELDKATRDYYQAEASDDDENWGRGLAKESSQAWDQE
jgi:hypothetical protein